MIKLGSPRYHYESLDSTMNLLNALAASGAPEGTIVVADEQLAGRGRAGRSWRARRGTALLCSVLLRPSLSPRELGPLPLIAGVAVAEAIEALAPVRARLKWPNDVFIGDRKVCGVLMQARAAGDSIEFVNLGIGLNVSASSAELPEGATSLRVASTHGPSASESGSTQGAPLQRHPVGEHLVCSRFPRQTGDAFETHSNVDFNLSDVETIVMERFSERYAQFLAGEMHASLAAWLERAMFLGEQVRIEQDGIALVGRFTGISGQGALQLETEGETREIVSGDLTRGPRPVRG